MRTLKTKEDAILNVFELHSDDCLVVSDSKGIRNIQEGDHLYLDDEVISGKIEVYTVASIDYSSYIVLEENDEVLAVINSLGIKLSEEVLDGLFNDHVHNFSSYTSDSS